MLQIILNHQPSPTIKLNNEPPGSKLGESSSNLDGKDGTWDGMKKFNNIPVNPEVHIEKPQMSNEELLKQKVDDFEKIRSFRKTRC